jgi:hypothetical protein
MVNGNGVRRESEAKSERMGGVHDMRIIRRRKRVLTGVVEYREWKRKADRRAGARAVRCGEGWDGTGRDGWRGTLGCTLGV